ncbi:MAG: hypothetical protein ACRYG7_11185 [Janthinobacterium lividum]
MKTLEEFGRVYEELGDALVKHVSLSFSTGNLPDIVVVLHCYSTVRNGDFVYLKLTFTEVQEFRVDSSDYRYSLTVIYGFAANQFEDLFVFDFAPMRLGPETMVQHRESMFYIACKNFNYEEIEWPEG